MSPLVQPPTDPDQLKTFPRRILPLDKPLFRIHRLSREPWWFSHDMSGRFDLTNPAGTCYVAESRLGAFIEAFKEINDLLDADIAERRISIVHVPRSMILADCTSKKIRGFGITGSIHSREEYELPQKWAAAFAGAGFEGVRYKVSHDPSMSMIGIAVFGSAGSADWPIISTTPIDIGTILDARRSFGIRVRHTL